MDGALASDHLRTLSDVSRDARIGLIVGGRCQPSRGLAADEAVHLPAELVAIPRDRPVRDRIESGIGSLERCCVRRLIPGHDRHQLGRSGAQSSSQGGQLAGVRGGVAVEPRVERGPAHADLLAEAPNPGAVTPSVPDESLQAAALEPSLIVSG